MSDLSAPRSATSLGFVRSVDALVTQQSLGQATGVIDFHSSGRCLVIGPREQALPLLNRLAGLAPALVPTLVSVEPQATGLDKRLTDSGISVFQTPELRISGHLGAFEVLAGGVGPDATQTNLAVAVFSETGCFDLVLDISAEACVAMPLKPLGYFHAPDEQALQAALEALPDMVGDFEKPRYFDFRSDWCAHSRSELPGCSRCISACAAGAISSSGEVISVDPYLCQGCGSCATTCPSGAITYAFPRVADAITRTRELIDEQQNTDTLVLHVESDRHSVEQAGLPATCLALEVEEVTAFGLDYWASLLCYGIGRILLVASGPDDDPGLRVLDEQRELLHQLLEGLGLGAQLPAVLRIPAEALSQAAREPMPNLLGKGPRAGFAIHGDKRATVRAALDTLSAAHAPERPVLALGAAAPFGRIEVDAQACTLCMACVSTCPAGAVLDGQDAPALRMIEANCVQCGLCATACPEQAISLRPQYTWDSVAARHTETLHEEVPFHCVSCHKPFATASMISTMLDKLSGHWMFDNESALRRLKMCEDCRVKDLFDEHPQGIAVHRELPDE